MHQFYVTVAHKVIIPDKGRSNVRKPKNIFMLLNFACKYLLFTSLCFRTYAYTFGLNSVKRAWAFNPKDDAKSHLNVVRMCCAIKPMTAWHLNKTATTCRERCGGQGYLSINRFGEIFASAHAGMTVSIQPK